MIAVLLFLVLPAIYFMFYVAALDEKGLSLDGRRRPP